MLITIAHQDNSGSSTTVTIDPAKLNGEPTTAASTSNGGTTEKGSQLSTDAERSFADRFGWPPQDVIVLEKESPTFDADKALIKATRLYGWNADHQREGGQKGAWVRKT
ncbi:MAG: hypothetical protein ACR2QH_00290 [Geminicoccaceae bacterium]